MSTFLGCSSLGSEPVDVFSSDNSRLKLHLPGKVLKKSKVRSGKLPATHANANLKRNIVDQAAQLGHKSPADAVQNSTGFRNYRDNKVIVFFTT